jgi:thiol-disulfide isomerase/thioredoxin
MQRFQAKKDSASAMMRRNPENAEAINQSFQQVYFQFTSYRTSFISKNANSPALLPVLSTLDSEKEYPTYESIMKQLINSFSGSPNVEAAKLQFAEMQKKRAASNALSSGNPAPLFSQADRNGDPISLKDLRGKVVLIDFWASWCGPCRKENPNVVNLYKKYKDAGFTVMSVSLDKDKNAWLAAIEKDGLIWPYHVSDLKYWSNEVAKLYQVSSIPFTVLVDRDGNIIDTKLRGMELEQALKTIFGF